MLGTTQLPHDTQVSLCQDAAKTLQNTINFSLDVQLMHIQDTSGQPFTLALPTTALKMLTELLSEMGKGHGVKLSSVHTELTTQQAADLLSMSRPTFIKLLDIGEMPYHRTGNRRKIALADVVTYQQQLEKMVF